MREHLHEVTIARLQYSNDQREAIERRRAFFRQEIERAEDTQAKALETIAAVDKLALEVNGNLNEETLEELELAQEQLAQADKHIKVARGRLEGLSRQMKKLRAIRETIKKENAVLTGEVGINHGRMSLQTFQKLEKMRASLKSIEPSKAVG